MIKIRIALITVAAALAWTSVVAQDRLQSSDLLKLRSVAAVQLSPDASRVAYVVENNDGPGRPWGQLWVMTIADRKSVRFGGDKDPSGNPEWSPDGQWIAYRGRLTRGAGASAAQNDRRSEEHTSELQSHSFISYAVFFLKKKKKTATPYPADIVAQSTCSRGCEDST